MTHSEIKWSGVAAPTPAAPEPVAVIQPGTQIDDFEGRSVSVFDSLAAHLRGKATPKRATVRSYRFRYPEGDESQ